MLLLAAFSAEWPGSAQSLDGSTKLLLASQRLKRLKRDRERQTVRWMDYEQRVKNVADSPERGWELALYYAVTGDENAGAEAVRWAGAHPRAVRQNALVLQWCGPILKDDDRKRIEQTLRAVAVPTKRGSADFAQSARDWLFAQTALNASASAGAEQLSKALVADLQRRLFSPEETYALAEYLDTAIRNGLPDPREIDQQLFANLPAEYLLHLRPAGLENPSWQMRTAALAIVSLDPNLTNAQFLQGWAIEDRQAVHEGPGVAEELLWGNPYLPGVSYQNLDPWIYDADGRLWARSDWTPQACWIHLAAGVIEQENCKANWNRQTARFGKLILIPKAEGDCTMASGGNAASAVILFGFAPHAQAEFKLDGKRRTGQADAAGLLRIPYGVDGKVCAARK